MAGKKKTRAVIGKLLTTTTGDMETGMCSPRSPLELQILSPTGLLNCDNLVGVGLGIVAALQKSGDCIPTPASKPDIEEEEEDGKSVVYVMRDVCLFYISPAPARLEFQAPSDFLRCCHHCEKELAGKDVYMYRGEKAFCSIECRCREIEEEEERRQKKHCSSEEAAAAAAAGHPPYDMGIFAI